MNSLQIFYKWCHDFFVPSPTGLRPKVTSSAASSSSLCKFTYDAMIALKFLGFAPKKKGPQNFRRAIEPEKCGSMGVSGATGVPLEPCVYGKGSSAALVVHRRRAGFSCELPMNTNYEFFGARTLIFAYLFAITLACLR